MKFKIYSINEWMESDNYIINEWFMEKSKFIESLFDENEFYRNLSFTNFTHDNSLIGDIRFAYVFFDDNEIEYKLEIGVDFKKLTNNYSPSNTQIVISEAEYKLSGEYINSEDTLQHIISVLSDDDITDDFIINLISEFKSKNEID